MFLTSFKQDGFFLTCLITGNSIIFSVLTADLYSISSQDPTEFERIATALLGGMDEWDRETQRIVSNQSYGVLVIMFLPSQVNKPQCYIIINCSQMYLYCTVELFISTIFNFKNHAYKNKNNTFHHTSHVRYQVLIKISLHAIKQLQQWRENT